MDATTTHMLASGNRMPLLGIGTWQLTIDAAGTIAQALVLGYRMIDTSGDYGTQPGIGEGMRRSGLSRDAVYIVTKVEETDDAYAAVGKNLHELGIEYADLILIHRPPAQGVGEDLWAGLVRARQEGLTRDIGVSNYSTQQLEALATKTREWPAVNQIEWSPFGHSDEMLDYCRQRNIILQAYSPLTRGTRLATPTIGEMARRYNKTPAQIVLRWNLQIGTVPLPKANQLQHLKDNLDVFDFTMYDDDILTLNSLNEEYSVLGPKLKYL